MHFQQIPWKQPLNSPFGRFRPQYTPPLSTTTFSQREQRAPSGNQPIRVSSFGASGFAMPWSFSQIFILSTPSSAAGGWLAALEEPPLPPPPPLPLPDGCRLG